MIRVNDYIAPQEFRFCRNGFHLDLVDRGEHCELCNGNDFNAQHRERLIQEIRNELAELRRQSGVQPFFWMNEAQGVVKFQKGEG